jgi:hypothetical protein
MGEDPPQGARPHLEDGLHELHPQQDAPRPHMPGREHLMLVVPLGDIRLNDPPVGGRVEVGRPAVRRDALGVPPSGGPEPRKRGTPNHALGVSIWHLKKRRRRV